MLAPDVRFEGFTTTDWVRVLSLFRPRPQASEARDPERPRGGVIAVHDRGALKKLLHTNVGRLRLDEAQRDWPMSAHALAVRHDASWACILSAGVLEDIVDRFAARVRRRDDLTAQTITLLLVAREEAAAGRIDLWPGRMQGVPIPPAAVVNSTIDSVCRAGQTMVVGLFEADELWTCFAMRRAEKGFDLVLGPDEVRADMGLLAGDWRRDYRHLAHAIEHRSGPLSLGCFSEVATLRSLLVDPTPGAWARAVAVRDVILSPLPPAMGIPLGIDAGRLALSALRDLTERMGPLGAMVPAIRAMMGQPADGEEERGLFGFHPLELLRKLISRDR
ncbi:MAG: hypothetical protein R3B70_44690 [Polyangiaceae bacterium]